MKSEVLDIGLHVTANGAAQGELCTVGRVTDLERASFLAWALWQFTNLFARNVIAIALPLVAWLAEVRIAPAEPL